MSSVHRTGPSIDVSQQGDRSRDDGYGTYEDLSLNEKTSSRTHLASHDANNPQYYPQHSTPPRTTHFQQPAYPQMSPENSVRGPLGGSQTLLPSHLNPNTSPNPNRSGASSPMNGEKPKRPKSSRNGSWDLLGNVGGRDFEEFDVRTGGKTLTYAEGDVGTTRAANFYYFLLSKSIVSRWILFIVPILAILWIPGIVYYTGDDEFRAKAKIWGTRLNWWSIWLSVFWGAWWAASAVFMLLPGFLRATIASIIGGDKSWTDLAKPLRKWLTLFAWSLASWLSFINLVNKRADSGNSEGNKSNLSLVTQILFGVFLCSAVILGEKVVVQMIAYTFHQQTYQDRMHRQEFEIKALVTLYTNSSDMGRSDTLKNSNESTITKGSQFPKVFAKKALKGLRSAASNSANMLGNVASEMAGSSVLQPNSPQSMVTASLSSANKTRMLARRIYYSFRQGKQEVEIADVARFFPTLDIANEAFEVLDRDGNGGATRDEIEMSLMEIHRERLSLASSMRDLDGAVSRLDNILMSIVLLICVLILTAMVTTKLTALVTSAGTFLLGLSWLIGSTAQEVLGSCIFLFVKHPFDVGDRVDFDTQGYVVQEMNLMSTVFRRLDGKHVFVSNNVLNTKLIENIRRSGPTSETFAFDVAFETTFNQIQALREKMMVFVKKEGRDFLPTFDISISDFPTQASLNLKADIKYKTNWQQGALKVQRRNKWICALKEALAELHIFGPAGAGNPSPDPAGPIEYTQVPYIAPSPAPAPTSTTPLHRSEDSGDNNSRYGSETLHLGRGATAPKAPSYDFVSRANVISDPSQDIFGEEEDTTSTMPPTRATTPAQSRVRQRRPDEENPRQQQETIEMDMRPVR